MVTILGLRKKTYQLLEGDIYKSKRTRLINTLLIILIIVNVITVILESDHGLRAQYAFYFMLIDLFSVTVFSIEYILRVWCCVERKHHKQPSSFKMRLKYMVSPIPLIDLLAIAPFFISFFIIIDLRYLRLLRVLRLLKITHYFKGFDLFITVLLKESKNIAATIFSMLLLMVIAASLMYTIENQAQPEVFSNILHSLWWTVVTMTTVGYGDITPITVMGKIVATFVMFIGVALVALPTAILAASFSEELRYRKRNLDSHVKEVLTDGIIDHKEYKELQVITKQLQLRPEDLRRTIKFLKNNSKNLECPHCGKQIITPSRRADD